MPGTGGAGTTFRVGVEAVTTPFPVTIGAIAWMVFRDTPTRARSFADPYGLPATILFAVAAPIPGSDSRSFGLAVFRSIGGIRAVLAGFFFAAAASTGIVSINAQATARQHLTKHTGMAERITPRLRIDA